MRLRIKRLSFGLGALVTLLAPFPRAEVKEQIVAQVNNDIITLSEYNREKDMLFRMLRGQLAGQELQQRYDEAVKTIIPTMIDELLLIDKAKEFGFTTDLDLEAKQFVDDLMKRERVPSVEVLKSEMAKQGVVYSEYMEGLKKQIMLNRIRGAIVRQKVKIMQEDIQAYYKANAKEYAIPESIELQEIVVYSKDKTADQVQEKIALVVSRLKAGEPFEDVAKDMSEGPSAASGGKMGTFTAGALSALISKAVANLQSGQITEPLKADYGTTVIKLSTRTPASTKPYEEVKEEIEDQLFRQKINPVIEDYVKELREESYVYVAPEFRSLYDPGKKAGEPAAAAQPEKKADKPEKDSGKKEKDAGKK